jgi:hypothetical protein
VSTNETFIQYKLTKVRLTKLNRCGARVDDGCSSFVDNCIVSIEETGEYKDREEWFFENGDGDFCATQTTPPKLKWLNLTLTFNDVNPGIIPFLTGDTVILNDAATPQQIGYGRDYGAASLSNFALEGWTRIASMCDDPDACPDDGAEWYGYTLYAWVKEGTMGDVTYQNDLANFVVEAIAVRNSPWGVGPYNVIKSSAAATLGVPMPLLSSYSTLRFKEVFLTQLPPPFTQCDCTDLTPTELLFVDAGAGAHHGTLTLPTRGGSPIVPGYVTWGDASPAELVTAGPTVLHNYVAAGSYAPTYKPSNESGVTYAAASTPIA